MLKFNSKSSDFDEMLEQKRELSRLADKVDQFSDASSRKGSPKSKGTTRESPSSTSVRSLDSISDLTWSDDDADTLAQSGAESSSRSWNNYFQDKSGTDNFSSYKFIEVDDNKPVVPTIEQLRAQYKATSYLGYLRHSSLFSAKDVDSVITKLQTRAAKNEGGASSETLKHFGLGKS